MKLTIGTRGSRLALWQAHYVQGLLADIGVQTDLEIIRTRGDNITDRPFSKMVGKGFFTKELEDAQRDGRVDLAVHSAKDLGSEMPDGLVLAALIGREDPRDVLIARPQAVDGEATEDNPVPLVGGALVGTSSARRQAQIRYLRPDVVLKDLRGNVPTRVAKLANGEYDAIILAQAGIVRLELDLEGLVAMPLPIEHFVPAPGQGMLAIQCRNEPEIVATLGRLASPAAVAVEAERSMLASLAGGCQVPLGVHIQPESPGFHLHLFWKYDDGEPLVLDLREATAPEVAARALELVKIVGP